MQFDFGWGFQTQQLLTIFVFSRATHCNWENCFLCTVFVFKSNYFKHCLIKLNCIFKNYAIGICVMSDSSLWELPNQRAKNN